MKYLNFQRYPCVQKFWIVIVAKGYAIYDYTQNGFNLQLTGTLIFLFYPLVFFKGEKK
tara:strand:- start:67 stop:240 length:174 start_codon:yes stop_codon:yes gene_type:complete